MPTLSLDAERAMAMTTVFPKTGKTAGGDRAEPDAWSEPQAAIAHCHIPCD
ncbi:hypothetical protein [Leptolyngbya iicbica]|uniref:Uncharacterized protein n=1 Tax=Lyngbya confervoides BDU141951 TaxID=1574623 RepID=A0A8T6QQN1_9CYAN|nr:hypothetical protein [Leptolyngbya sp. LK]